MVKLIIASLRAHAGKTSIIAGLANVLDKPFGYMKPFGDRSLYRKKRLWDQDAALMTHLFGLTDAPEEMSIGFDHSKLQYIYDEDSRREKLHEVVRRIGTGKEKFCSSKVARISLTGHPYALTPSPWPSSLVVTW